MTDLSQPALFAITARRRIAARPWRLLPYVCVFAAGSVGLLAGWATGGDVDAFDSKLLLLLRFMAAVKFAGVIVAAIIVHWRMTHPIGRGFAAAYVAALITMAMAPGLIWSMGGIAMGALLFHTGLLAFLALAWKDDGARLPSRR